MHLSAMTIDILSTDRIAYQPVSAVVLALPFEPAAAATVGDALVDHAIQLRVCDGAVSATSAMVDVGAVLSRGQLAVVDHLGELELGEQPAEEKEKGQINKIVMPGLVMKSAPFEATIQQIHQLSPTSSTTKKQMHQQSHTYTSLTLLDCLPELLSASHSSCAFD